MALQDWATQEMVTITEQWLHREKQRPLIERLPRVAPLLPDLAEAHEKIVVFQNRGKQQSADVAELRARTSRLDAEHDGYSRAIHHLLLGLSEIAESEEASSRIDELRAELLPQGLGINQQRYLVQAGEVALREQRLSPESNRLLESIVLVRRGCADLSLRELVNRWGKVAHELGEAESQKVRIQAGEVSEGSRGPARRAWVSIVSLFLQMLERETGLSEAERRQLLEPLRHADAKAVKRRALAKQKNVPFDPDAEEEGEEAVS